MFIIKNYDNSIKYLLRQIKVIGVNKKKRTIIDIKTINDAKRLMKIIVKNEESVDIIIQKFVKLYELFIPLEKYMRYLSIMQQEYEGTGGEEEYIITTIYGASIIAINKHIEKGIYSKSIKEAPF